MTGTAAKAEIEIPKLKPWPSGLSNPLETPDGVLLPFDLAEAVDFRLLECESLPDDFELAAIEYRLLLFAEFQKELEVQEASIYAKAADKIKQARDTDGWPTWQVALIVAAGVASGIIIGGMAGYLGASK